MSRLSGKQTVEGTWIDEEIPTLDAKKNSMNNLPVMCAVTQVDLQMPSEAALLESQQGDMYCQNSMKMVGSKPPWVLNNVGMLCRKAPVEVHIQIVAPSRP